MQIAQYIGVVQLTFHSTSQNKILLVITWDYYTDIYIYINIYIFFLYINIVPGYNIIVYILLIIISEDTSNHKWIKPD